jgi:hypothetical protein
MIKTLPRFVIQWAMDKGTVLSPKQQQVIETAILANSSEWDDVTNRFKWRTLLENANNTQYARRKVYHEPGETVEVDEETKTLTVENKDRGSRLIVQLTYCEVPATVVV